MTAEPRPSTRPLHAHFQSNPEAAPVFHATPERYEAAARRHPELASYVRATIGWTQHEFYEAMQTADVLIGFHFPREDFGRVAPNVKWIHIWGAGVEHLLPLDWLPSDVHLVSNSGVHGPKAGEFMTMALLMVNNAMPALMSHQRHARWFEIFSTTIAGRVLALVGVGEMGGMAAERAKQLGMTVLAVRRTGRPHPHVDEMYGPDGLGEILPRADIVLVTAPLTRETRGLIGRAELDMLRPDASFINMGRAGVVDYDALADKLARGELKGAMLDVFDREPLPPESPLWSVPNLVITPHVASDDNDAYMPRTMDLFFENVDRYLGGRALRNTIQKDQEY